MDFEIPLLNQSSLKPPRSDVVHPALAGLQLRNVTLFVKTISQNSFTINDGFLMDFEIEKTTTKVFLK